MTPQEQLAAVRHRLDALEFEAATLRNEVDRLQKRLQEQAPDAVKPTQNVSAVQAPLSKEELPPPLPVAAAPIAPPAAVVPPPPKAVEKIREPVSFGDAVPRVAPSAQTPPPVFTPQPPPRNLIKEWLQAIHFWPPDSAKGREANLGAWWATRLGTLLAAIGVVFFGLYLSLSTPPWVRFIELVAVSVGITFAGRWLERKYPAFGVVVFAGGLSLVGFCGYAGYALAAVHVFDSVLLSAVWQVAAAAGLLSAAFRRNSQTLAGTAVALGFVTALFSGLHGLPFFALATGAVLVGASLLCHRLRGWEGPSVVSLPGAYALFVLAERAAFSTYLGALLAWGYLLAVALAGFLRDWQRSPDSAAVTGRSREWFLGANTSLALLAGFQAAWFHQRTALSEFYFLSAGILAALAVVLRRRNQDDRIVALLLGKATGALALGLVNALDARTTALALLVQAAVSSVLGRKLNSRVLDIGAYVVAAVSVVFFLDRLSAGTPAVGVATLSHLLFVSGLAGFGVLSSRSRPLAEQAIQGVTGILGSCAAASLVPQSLAPAWHLVFALPLGLLAVVLRRAAVAIGSVIALVIANGVFHAALSDHSLESHVALCGLLVVAADLVVFFGALALGEAQDGRKLAHYAAAIPLAAAALAGIRTLFELQSPGVAANQSAGIALVVLLAAVSRVRGRQLPLVAAFAAVVATVLALSASYPLGGRLPLAWSGGLFIAGIVGLYATKRGLAEVATCAGAFVSSRVQLCAGWLLLVVGLVDQNPLDAGIAPALSVLGLALVELSRRLQVPGARFLSVCSWLAAFGATLFIHSEANWQACAVAASLIAWVALLPSLAKSDAAAHPRLFGLQVVLATGFSVGLALQFAFAPGALLLAGTACLAFFLNRTLAKGSLAAASAVLLAVAAARTLDRAAEGTLTLSEVGLTAGIAILVTAWPLVTFERKTNARERACYACGILALAIAFEFGLLQKAWVSEYATLVGAAASVLLFVTGLFLRSKPYRIVSLTGLSLSILRLFLVDIDSTLFRIAAFVGLGLLLLWVGFSYNRFRHFVEED